MSKKNIKKEKITDPYMDDNLVIDRLFKEWVDHGKIIIAFDYDNTVFDYEKKGHLYTSVIQLLQDCTSIGAHLYCFTSCGEDKYDSINQYLEDNDIISDGINIDYDFIPFRGRKPYYNILLDDRAGLSSAYQILRSVCDMIYNIKLLNQ